MATNPKLNLDELAANIVRCFPSLNALEQRLSLELYRLLAEGQPVPGTALAKRLDTSVETVNRILDGWPGVYSDAEQQIHEAHVLARLKNEAQYRDVLR